ncbi:MAG: hypothetical protein Q8Q92_01640 [bacterium]|nr:hypothetical protein [bacterium]
MSIHHLLNKINIPLPADSGVGEVVSYDKDGHIYPAKAVVERFPLFQKLFLSLIIILTALLSFGIGRLSVAGDREPIRIENDPEISNDQFLISNQTASVIKAVGNTEVVVSKNGTKYHYLRCPGAKQIKEENKIVFATPEAAEASGFTLAANCLPR